MFKLLSLHGAGTSTDKNRINYIKDKLAESDIQLLSFDFGGHGNSKLKLNESSLKRRVADARRAIKKFKLNEPLNLIGSSMGGYIAIKFTEIYKVENLILFVPGVYTPEAFDVPFTAKFSQIIRVKDSWKNSDAFAILNNFKGNALIFVGEKDTVIPDELIKMLFKSLKNAKSKKIITIGDSPHAIHTFISQDKTLTETVAQEIIRIVKIV